jgi:hypothetical protein
MHPPVPVPYVRPLRAPSGVLEPSDGRGREAAGVLAEQCHERFLEVTGGNATVTALIWERSFWNIERMLTITSLARCPSLTIVGSNEQRLPHKRRQA